MMLRPLQVENMLLALGQHRQQIDAWRCRCMARAVEIIESNQSALSDIAEAADFAGDYPRPEIVDVGIFMFLPQLEVA